MGVDSSEFETLVEEACCIVSVNIVFHHFL